MTLHCGRGGAQTGPTDGAGTPGRPRRRLRTWRPRHADRLVRRAARLVDVALDDEPVAQPPHPAGRRVDHPADAPGVHAAGAQDAVVELDVLVRLRAQLLPDARDVGEVRPQAVVTTVWLRAAREAAGR